VAVLALRKCRLATEKGAIYSLCLLARSATRFLPHNTHSGKRFLGIDTASVAPSSLSGDGYNIRAGSQPAAPRLQMEMVFADATCADQRSRCLAEIATGRTGRNYRQTEPKEAQDDLGARIF
jgi:hypothetical protein